MTDEQRGGGEGPLPVRASLSGDASSADAAEAPADPTPQPVKRFRHGDEAWLARIAGESAYGTGRHGRAYLVAVHFLRASDDTTPVKEALIPAARFHGLAESELRRLLEEAVTIDLDREPSTTSRQARRSLGGRSGKHSSGKRS